MTSFLGSNLLGPMGVSAQTQNLITTAADFVTRNRDGLQRLLMQAEVKTTWHLFRVYGVSTPAISANRWLYILRKAQPTTAAAPGIQDAGLTELTEVSGYNLAEFGNTASIAAGGVDVVRAAASGFTVQPVPVDTLVHGFVTYKTDGTSIVLFERMNALDGECPSNILITIDGGTF
jgi:hypothetical protein